VTRTVLDPFSEYESRTVALPASAARDLAAAAKGKLDVRVSSAEGEYLVTASQYVGTVLTPEIALIVRPKIPLHNLFALLDVGLPQDAWRGESFSYAFENNLLVGFAELFARSVERALGRGVRRDYRAEHERLPALRGRIDYRELARRPGRTFPLPCEFDDYSADIPENRYLKAAVNRLLRVPGVRAETRRTLSFLQTRLEDVADTHVLPESIATIPSTRLNAHYWPALRLANLVLRNLSLIDRAGDADAASFMLDMNDLFQRWVTDRLRRLLRPHTRVVAEPKNWSLDERSKVRLLPDLTFISGDRLTYVGDVKYKLTDSGLGRTADYYQLLAYTTARRLTEGVLIYCQGAGSVTEREVVVRHGGPRLMTYQVDLKGSPRDIDAEIRKLAEWINQRAISSSPLSYASI
jgi:5-methylcytosine-specific restriction enzyme subunit McrC